MALIRTNKIEAGLSDTIFDNMTSVADTGDFTGAVVGKKYIVFQTVYDATQQVDGSFGTFTGATILSKHFQVASGSGLARICLIQATDTTIKAFTNALTTTTNTGVSNYAEV